MLVRCVKRVMIREDGSVLLSHMAATPDARLLTASPRKFLSRFLCTVAR